MPGAGAGQTTGEPSAPAVRLVSDVAAVLPVAAAPPTPPLIVIVGVSADGAGTADRSYPHAPQKRSPDSSGSSQLGQADSWGICDINYTHVRGR